MPDLSLEERIRACLATARRAALAHIDVAVDGGTVTLTGSVPSFYAKQQAQELVKRVPGVLHIVNQIVVKS